MKKHKQYKTFEEFLKANMSWYDFEHLNEYLSESPQYTNKLVRDPRIAETKDLLIIEMLLTKWNPELNRQYLRDVFQFGLQETQTVVIR